MDDETLGHLSVEAVQVLGDLRHLGIVSAGVIGHAELVPDLAIHRLQARGALERGSRIGMVSLGGQGDAKPVPGGVETRPQADRLAKGIDGLGQPLPLVIEIPEVEPGVGIPRVDPQRLPEPVLGLVVARGRREQIGKPMARAKETRIVGQRGAVLVDGLQGVLAALEHRAAEIVAPGLEVHGKSGIEVP